MSSTKDLLHQILDPSLSPNQRAELRCELAKQLEDAGNYEAALDAMGELWQGVGEQPLLEDLDQRTSANVLLRIGALTGYIGSAKQFENAQELAKNRITESIAIFESLYGGSDHSRYYVVSVKSDHQAQASFEQAIEISERAGGLEAQDLQQLCSLNKSVRGFQMTTYTPSLNVHANCSKTILIQLFNSPFKV